MKLLRLMLLASASFSSAATAQTAVQAPDLPPVVLAGEATFSIDQTGTVRTITQSTARAFLDWSSLDVPIDHVLRFEQPDASAITLNRVTGGSASVIDGLVEANGQVWILNPNGVFISPTGRVTTPGFLASTGNISPTEFMNGTTQFSIGARSSAPIVNAGAIASNLGYTILHASSVENGGQISANLGAVLLAAGDNLSISFDQGQLISFALSHDPSSSATIRELTNTGTGTITAEGGLVALSMASALGAISGVVNVDGLIEANTAQFENGTVILDAGANGVLRVRGTVSVEGVEAGETGGLISASGSQVMIEAEARLSADGATGGGEIAIAATPSPQTVLDYSSLYDRADALGPAVATLGQSLAEQQERLLNGSLASISIGQGSILSASARELGNGGVIAVDANGSLGLSARIAGQLRANGAGTLGEGGTIKLSGFHLDIEGAELKALGASPLAKAGTVELTAAAIDVVDQLTAAEPGVLAWQSSASLPFYEGGLLQSLDLGDDQVSQRVPLGFGFLYFGETYDSIEVSSNGLVSFGTLNGDSLCCNGVPLDGLGAPPAIFGLWTDLAPHYDPATGTMRSPTGNPRVGTMTLPDGRREFVIQWSGVSEFFNGQLNSFEIRIRETGEILLNYGGLNVTSHSVTAGLTGRTINDTSQLFYREGPFTNNNVLSDISNSHALFRQPDPVSQISTQSIYAILEGGSNLTINTRDFSSANSLNAAVGNFSISQSSFLDLAQGGHERWISIFSDKDIQIEGDQVFSAPVALRLIADANGDGAGGTIRLGNVLGPSLIDITGDVLLSGSTELRSAGDLVIRGSILSDAQRPGYFLTLAAQRDLDVTGSLNAGHIALDIFRSGMVSGPIAASTLVIDGPGDLTLGGHISGVSELTIAEGTLRAANAESLGEGQIVFAGGKLELTNLSDTTLFQPITVVNSGSITFAGSGTLDSLINAGSDATGVLTVEAAGDLTISGQIGTGTRLQGFAGFAGGRVVLGQNALISASSFVDLFGLSGFSNFSARTDVLSAGDGWTIWSGNLDPFGEIDPDILGALEHDWRFYGITEAQVRQEVPLPLRPAGNGLAYGLTPVLSVQALGNISKVYDGSRVFSPEQVSLGFAGLVNGDLALTDTVIATAITSDLAGVGASQATISGISASFVDSTGRPVFGYQFDEQIVAPASILPRPLLASLIGTVSRDYDGTTDALLTGENFALEGLVAGEMLTVTQTAGSYADRNVGSNLLVTATLGSGDFAAGSGTDLSNYLLPATASGLVGSILPRPLLASLIGTVSRDYDGTTDALLTGENFALEGLVAGEMLTVTQTAGSYADRNVGSNLLVTATLGSGDFAAGSGTDLSNYLLPATASGLVGSILPRPLLASLIGTVSRDYDGTTDALLTGENFALEGLVAGEMLTVTQTAGSYADRNVGSNLLVTATLGSGDFAAGSGTDLSNYLLPATASGLVGSILPRPLLASLIGTVSRDYDGTTDALLTGENFALEGLVAGEMLTVTQTAGSYADRNVGSNLLVTATLGSGDFAAGSGTDLSNYLLPATASGLVGSILPRPLLASLIGTVSRDYDGTTDALLTGENFALEGLVAGEMLTVTQTAGSYADRNVGSNLLVTATLGSGDFAAGSGTDLSNYLLPATASGLVGSILPRPLLASLIGTVSRDYDGTTDALLTGENFALEGLVAGEMLTVTQTAGSYADRNVGSNLLVTATLGSGDFAAGSGTDLSNYLLPATASGLVGSILPRPLLASLIGTVSRDYDGTTDALLTGENFALEGLVAGEMLTVTQTAGSYADRNVGSNLLVTATLGSGDFAAGSGTDLSNYLLPATASGLVGSILPRPLLASLIGTVSRDYDGTTDALLTGENFALEGLVAGEMLTVTQTAGSYADRNVGSNLLVTATLGSGDFAAGSGTDLSNYLLPATASGLVGSILPRPLLASLIGTVSRDYDGTTDALLTGENFALEGLVAGEMLTVTQTAGSYADRNVGSNLLVTATLGSGDFAAGSGTDLSNYLLPATASGLVGSILPRPLLASLIGTVSRDYDGTTDALLTGENFALEGLVAGEMLTVTQTAGSYADRNVGSNLLVTATLGSGDFAAGSGTDLSNYLLPATASGLVGSILPRPLLASLIGTVSRDYDGTTDALLTGENFALEGLVAGEMLTVTQTAGSYADRNVGSNLLVTATLGSGDFAAGSGTDLSNYLLPATASGLVGSILPRPLLASLIGTVSRDYDGTTDALLTGENFALEGLVAGEMLTVTQTAGSYADRNVGSNLLVTATLGSGDFAAGSGTDLSNYLLPATASGLVGSILPRPLLASLIGTVSRDYDGTTDALLTGENFALEGLVAGEMLTVTQTAGSYADRNVGSNLLVTATLGSGDFAAGSGTDLSNYLLPATASGLVGSILPRPLLASLIGTVSRDYDGTTDALLTGENFALEGLVAGEMLTVTQTAGSYADRNVGSNLLVTATLGSGDFAAGSGTDLSNYLLPATASGLVGSILPRPLLASLIGTVSRDYDGTTDALLTGENFALEGLVAGEMLTVTQTAGSYADRNVGSNLLVTATLGSGDFAAGSGTDLSNYLLPATASGLVGSILPRPLLASLIGTVSRDYDGTTDALLTGENFALEGLVAGEMLTVTQTAGSYADRNVGSNLLVTATLGSGDFAAGSGTDLSNYLLPATASGLVGSILPRPLLASLIGTVSRDYDGTTDALLTGENFALEGLVAGEMLTVTQTAGSYADRNVGSNLLVTATLGSGDFAAGSGTDLSNYLLPATASGLVGSILPRPLLASLIGTVSRDYDGTTDALLTGENFALEGLVAGEMLTVTQTAGSYADRNVGSNLLVTATLGSGDFAAGSGTDLSNYLLPATASGLVGSILPRPLLASLIGTVSRDYDGTTDALLTGENFALEGLVAGEMLTVTQTAGSYADRNVGSNLLVTATLGSGDFAAGSGTDLSNYLLPATASGLVGSILPRPLLASLIGTVSRDYDGTTDALLTGENFALEGLVAGEMLTVTQTAGSYADRNVGSNLLVTATLGSGDFAAGSGTDLSNYLLPATASGLVGSILPRPLLASLIGTVSRDYDGTTDALLTGENFALEGLVAGEMLTVTQTAGSYADRNVGSNLLVTATLGSGDFAAGSGTDLSNYLLPATASGLVGSILPRPLLASLIGTVSRDYDGTTDALLTGENFALEGLVAGEMLTVTQTAGSYADRNVGSNLLVTATLGSGDFAAGSGTDLSNYLLPATASGLVGSILPRPLLASLIGTVSRDYDGTTDALLTGENFALEGLVAGEMLTVTQTAGSYADRNVGSNLLVTATLGSGDFAAGSGTDLSNYLLPATASGLVGSILPLTLTYRADPAVRFSGAPNPIFTGSVTGFLMGENIATATSGTLVFTSTATNGSDVGRYPINGSGLFAVNYVFVQASENLTALTIQPNIVNQISTVGSQAQNPTPGVAAVPSTAPGTSTSPNAGSGSDAGTESSASGSSSSVEGPTSEGASEGVTSSVGSEDVPDGSDEGTDNEGSRTNDEPSSQVVTLEAEAAEPLPPSPVGNEPTPTPTDPEDASDPVLAAASTAENAQTTAEQVSVAITPFISVSPQMPDAIRPVRQNGTLSINALLNP